MRAQMDPDDWPEDFDMDEEEEEEKERVSEVLVAYIFLDEIEFKYFIGRGYNWLVLIDLGYFLFVRKESRLL